MVTSKSIPLTPDVEKFRRVVLDMDAQSQNAFSSIVTVAKLALARLETPEGHQHLDDIANALGLIWSTAESAENFINCEAETVGCNYRDEAQRRRWDAERQVRDAAKEVHHV